MKKRRLLFYIWFLIVCSVQYIQAQSKIVPVSNFEKIIVSPHIEAVLKEGTETSVTINKLKIPEDKVNIKVEGNTLRVYLEGAKMVAKSEKGAYGKKSIYNGTMLTVTITYKTLKKLSIRGKEVIRCISPIQGEEIKLAIYGDSKVYFDAITLEELSVAIYGESYLEIKSGFVGRQTYKAYGVSEINTLELDSDNTKITAYGESNFRVKVSNRLKVTCYGESSINYKGDPYIDKGIVIGESTLRKII